MDRLRKIMQFLSVLFGIADHDAKRAADRTSSEMREEVQRMHDTAKQMSDKATVDPIEELDMFALLAHDMRNEEQRRIAERGE